MLPPPRRGDDATTTAPHTEHSSILDKLKPCPTPNPLWRAPLLAEVPAARILWVCGYVDMWGWRYSTEHSRNLGIGLIPMLV